MPASPLQLEGQGGGPLYYEKRNLEANNSNPHHDIDGHRHDLWSYFVYVNKEGASRTHPLC